MPISISLNSPLVFAIFSRAVQKYPKLNIRIENPPLNPKIPLLEPKYEKNLVLIPEPEIFGHLDRVHVN